MTSLKCVLDESVECVCEDAQKQCKGLLKHKKVVYCAEYRCTWNQSVPFEKFIAWRRFEYTHFKDLGYNGICVRSELGIRPKTLDMTKEHWELAICPYLSITASKGHMDWSRFPEGGNIPDPISGDTVYHV